MAATWAAEKLLVCMPPPALSQITLIELSPSLCRMRTLSAALSPVIRKVSPISLTVVGQARSSSASKRGVKVDLRAGAACKSLRMICIVWVLSMVTAAGAGLAVTLNRSARTEM